MRKKQLFSLLMLLIVLGNITTFSFATETKSQKKIDMESGQIAGEASGKIAAQRDYINGRPRDWNKAHELEKSRAIIHYELVQEPYVTRINFLEGFRISFMDSYEIAYSALVAQDRSGDIDIFEYYDYGISHGYFFGNLLGHQNGVREYHEGKESDWRRSVPSESDLIREYALDKDRKSYRDEFIISFIKAYQEAYNSGFSFANAENHRVTKEMGFSHGETAGKAQGEVLGKIDFLDGNDNNWMNALPTDSEIVTQANLLRENPQYREGYVAGYKEGFKKGYTEVYQQSNLTFVLDNIKVEEVSMLGKTINSTDEFLTLEIKPGSFYWETIFSLEKDVMPVYFASTERLEAVTRKYTLGIANHIGYIVLKEPMKLTFTYYGSEKAGIYQMIDGKWRYMFSQIEGNTISTLIPKGAYSGGTYAVLLDEGYPELKDIYTHWASKEIYTFVRRFYVEGYSDRTFRPSENVSRGEFVTVLGRVLEWSAATTMEKEFSDAHEFGDYHIPIMQAVAEGYIEGYSDQTFRAKNPITYQEIEWIMKRVPGNEDFSWKDIEESMFYEKYTRSDSRLSMKNKITRGEIIYMLHQLQEAGKF